MLGGFEETSAPDLKASNKFLNQIKILAEGKLPKKPNFKTGRALDCGAGMGRVTKGLLLKQFDEVDLVEPVGSLLNKAKTYVGTDKAVNFYEQPLQNFYPESCMYDCIWNQWVLLYLADDDLIAYLRRCAESLRENGIICVKENVVMEGQFVVDDEDNSITRTHAQYRKIFKDADLDLIIEQRQTDWPQDLFPVMMYALKPKVYMPKDTTKFETTIAPPRVAYPRSSSKASVQSVPRTDDDSKPCQEKQETSIEEEKSILEDENQGA